MKTTADRLTKRQEDLPRRPQDAEVAVMNIDIVTRLRIVWTSCTDRINKERADAADEIERLRNGGCARDQNTTQFCAEAVALQREVERLRAERDEARREVCELRCNPPERFIGLPQELAKVNNWDCFRENTDGK